MVSLYEIGKHIPDSVADAGANAYVIVNSLLRRNYHEFQYAGCKFRYEYRDYRTFTELHGAIADGKTASEGISLDHFDLEDRDGAIDIGAHFGLYTVLLGVLNPDIPVYAYEPTQYNTVILSRNIRANDLDPDRVEINQYAVTGHDGTVTFHQDPDFQGSTRDTIHPPSEAEVSFDSVEIESISISSLLEEKNLERPFLKIDAEGAELEILKDLTRAYDGDAKGIVEIHADRIEGGEDAVLELLETAGYSYKIVKKEPKHRRAYTFWKDHP